MYRITTVEEFESFRRQVAAEPSPEVPCLVICAGTGGQAAGSNDLMRIIKRQILERGLKGKISLRITGCQGFCELDPFIIVEPGKNLYPKLSMEDVPRIIDAALSGRVIEELLYRESDYHECSQCKDDIPFFSKQTRLLLGKNELIDPIRIFNYIKKDGYSALGKILQNPDPERIIREVQRSGLRGRGGAGFPTGKKWEFTRESKTRNGTKYVICNADEGDPGAYMDRSLLEGNPHSVIEGMIIAAIAIGANKGIIYVRSEYPLAIKHTLIALRQARELGILGSNILNTGIDFDIGIVRGAGAFVCGEETALMLSVEGKIGEPRQRPPYPGEKGLWGCPTCINNVETLCNVPLIIKEGAREYAKIGVEGNSGTKIFSLVGKVQNTGLVEVPMGMTIGEIIYDIGGGSNSKGQIKAVQTGGPSGGCIPARMFDLPVDYDGLAKAGSIMGSGGMIVMDEQTCMVDIAKYYMGFLKNESCGKCYTCRKGTQRMYEILEDITEGRGTSEQLALLEELARVVADTTLCGLGQTAPNPVLSTLRYFRQEYIEHIVEKQCRAGVCKHLIGAPCQSACPIGTEAWRYVAHISRGEYEDAYKAIRQENPFPSICARVCDHKCESRCRLGQLGDKPVAIRALKRFVTDNVDPSVFKVRRSSDKQSARIAVVGAGPAGLTAAHYLSLKGYPVTVFEMDTRPGGMLYSCIPSYRLPRNVLEKEIEAIFDDNVTLKTNCVLGRDFSVNSLFHDGYEAVFLALGAQKGRQLQLEGEDADGVLPSIEFLKAFNQDGLKLAKGRVGVIGGGNSAVDAARTALRQEEVESVTILYRRTREEMPAFEEEIAAALQEGIVLETLVTPVKIHTLDGRLTEVEFLRNRLGKIDPSGRRRPVPIEDAKFCLSLDTLIVAISEAPDINSFSAADERGLETTKYNTLKTDPYTLACSRPGVFAGGDVVRGPNTVVDAIADGKLAAEKIDRYIRGEALRQIKQPKIADVFVAPSQLDEGDQDQLQRLELPQVSVEGRAQSFVEVEGGISEAVARRESLRCLRCDIEFTKAEPRKTLEPAETVKG